MIVADYPIRPVIIADWSIRLVIVSDWSNRLVIVADWFNDSTASGRRAPRLKRLVKEAALRGTKLLLMPDGMVRHDSNTTTMISGGVRSDGVNDNGKKRQTSESPTSQGIGSAGQKGNGGCIKKVR